MIQKFLRLETAGGFLLMGALVLALIAENSPLNALYNQFLTIPVEIHIGELHLDKPLILWINDALMAVFFFLVGLELKREVLEGQLSTPSQIMLPALAALAGIAAPSLIYVWINLGNPEALRGWAIPAATDIAFALGVIALLGSRVPPSLKLFLLAVAIIDDIGAILIIAIFYSGDLSPNMFLISFVAIAILAFLNYRGVRKATPYVLVGIVLWVSILKSGVHATLAGIILAMFIPIERDPETGQSLLLRLEHDLHSTVAYVILPIFAFANAGINLSGLSLSDILAPVPFGIAAGLFLGKQLGIFTIIFVAVKTGLAKLPERANWMHVYGLSLLCGIGFTMSLFIASLAFSQSGGEMVANDRMGILVGSLLSAVGGYLVLLFASKKADQ